MAGTQSIPFPGSGASSAEPAAEPVREGAWRAVAVLTLLYWFGTLDRQVAALLIPMIKADLSLTDLQISMIQGLAFGLFFMIMSPLMGWLVDRYSRRVILFCGVVGWSISATASGLVKSFGGLFAARAGVGGCEASINPTAYAMLSELFPPKKLSLPMSLFVMGGNLGSGMSFLLGGGVIAWVSTSPQMSLPWIGPLAGWQLAFVVTGLPGLLLAPLLFTIPESRRPRTAGVTAAPSGFGDLWRHYRRFPVFYLTHGLGFALIMAFVVGLQSWNATFLMRAHGWALSDIGYLLGIFQVGSALIGLAFHGWAVDRLFGRGRKDAHLAYFALMCALAFPCATAAYLIDSGMATLLLYSLAYFFIMAFASIGPAALQITTPANLRGKASAVYMVGVSIIGTILGPIVVASFTDLLFQDEKALGWSMALFAALTTGLAGALFFVGRPAMRRAIDARMSAGA
ncbi:MFS transporter [Sphingosinicella ginsenosidimutans]|uniref:MFS transporter n=1 Tax=Allosphingosinicella ginsenosidimutans TaxID=1176539 RepID=A0A5C6TUZ4_9SPHN|nr:MFS transporter [Sphingosinicella ginsenosidimutans]